MILKDHIHKFLNLDLRKDACSVLVHVPVELRDVANSTYKLPYVFVRPLRPRDYYGTWAINSFTYAVHYLSNHSVAFTILVYQPILAIRWQ